MPAAEVTLTDERPDFQAPRRIGLIAGEGQFPVLLAKGAISQGVELIVFCINGYVNEELRSLADAFYVLKLTELTRLLDLAGHHDIRHLTMAGRIPHGIMLARQLTFEPRVLRIFRRAGDMRADSLLKAAIDEIESEGIRILESTMFLKACMPEAGLLTPGSPLTPEAEEDIAFGYPLAKEIARLDIGQTIVVKNKMVVAVEALEGTDELIARAGALAGPGAVFIKVAKPRQDMRFDVPVVGVTTLRNLAAVRAGALCLTAQKSLFFDRLESVEIAEQHGISIYAQAENEA